ncbi:MAG: NUDIX domain-containing protein [Candidatus Omnitrophica bacterium]|nr:NUDIX domain-containing protein [Candidatus Omnitrophota bacterium]
MKFWYLVMRGILINDKKQVLMLQRSAKSRTFPLLWEFPGGKVNPGEHFIEGLKREFREETGLLVEPERIMGANDKDFGDCTMAYMFVRVTGEIREVIITSEHEQFIWADKDSLSKLQVSEPLVDFLPEVLSLL